MSYIEIAIGSTARRGQFIPLEHLPQYLSKYSKTMAMFQSVYLYPDEILDYLRSHNSIKGYTGSQGLSFVPIDIDKGEDSIEYTLQRLRAVIFKLEQEGLNAENYQVYYSGRGYHIEIHAGCFGFQASSDLPYLLKETMKKISNDIDLAVYKRGALYRCKHSLNTKSGRYKIPLSYSEMMNLSAIDIEKKASTQRLSFPYEQLYGDGELAHLIVKDVPTIRNFTKVVEPFKIVPCIQAIYNAGPQKGSRNNSILRMVSHFRRCGIPSNATKAALLAWNAGSLEEQLILSKVEYIYNSNYKYGCSDYLLKKFCSPRCIHFKRKDYLVDVFNADQLQKSFEERLSTDWTGRVIDLGRIFGLHKSIDTIIYPGELVTIFGPTGCNKTALAQNIVLGYDMEHDIIDRSLNIPTLYLTLELSPWVMHRRNLQIVSDKPKEETNENMKELYRMYKKDLAHIQMQSTAPTIKQIQEKVKELQPACLVVDYIDLVELGNYQDTAQIRFVSHELSNLAINLDIIVIQLSQISRMYSREEVIDLYAGKGSGAIENASRKVIGINGNQKSPERTIEMLKNSDGDLFSFNCKWTPSWRLKKIIE